MEFSIDPELAKDRYGRVKKLKDGSYRVSLIVTYNNQSVLRMDGYRVTSMCSRLQVPQLIIGGMAIPLSEVDRELEDAILAKLKRELAAEEKRSRRHSDDEEDD